jgi:uncharacterized protein YwgA
MENLFDEAILISLINKLREQDSWCGETHVQKSTYILKEFLRVPLSFDFILYKHGPFSFELQDKLTEMRAYRLLELEPQSPPYSPKYNTTSSGEKILNRNCDDVEKYENHIKYLSIEISKKGIAELERIATALFIIKKLKCSDIEICSKELTKSKPHIQGDEAKKAITEANELISKIKEFLRNQNK